MKFLWTIIKARIPFKSFYRYRRTKSFQSTYLSVNIKFCYDLTEATFYNSQICANFGSIFLPFKPGSFETTLIQAVVPFNIHLNVI